MTQPITDLKVIIGGSSSIEAPPGFTKIPVDLNKGSGGKYIYLCFNRNPGNSITDLAVVLGENASPPSGFIKIPEDLNKSVGGEYIYLCYEKAAGVPITDIVFQSTGGNEQSTPYYNGVSYSKIPVDLNKGSGGDYIYLYYLQQQPEQIPDFTFGIPPRLLTNPDKEYEVGRHQIDYDKMLVWVKKLNFSDRVTIGPNISREYTVAKKVGVSKSEQQTFSVEVGISASASYGAFSAEINTKIGYTTTSSFSTSEETTTTIKTTIPTVDYTRTIAFVSVVDILRVVSIPRGDTRSEMSSYTPDSAVFSTNQFGKWEAV